MSGSTAEACVMSVGQGIMIDYLCAKFGDFSLSRFGFTCGQTDRQNHRGG